MHALDLGATLNGGWQTFSRNAVALIVGFLLVVIVGMCSLCICIGPMTVGYNRMLLRAARGEVVAIGDVFSGFNVFMPSFLLTLLMMVLSCVGMLACGVGALVVGFGFYWAHWIMADGCEDPIECLRRSWAYSTSNIGPMLIFLIVNQVVLQLGNAVAVGTLLTGPLAMAMLAHGYLRAFSSAPAEARAY